MLSKLLYLLSTVGPIRIGQYIFLEATILIRVLLKNSHSQWGDDIVIDDLLKNKKKGFYVDVGAYDPSRFSNTKRFYLRGWRGINIEPDPARIQDFYIQRPRDINLNIGIGNKNSTMKFYKFIPNTLSTFSGKRAKEYQKQCFKLLETRSILVQKLADTLEKHIKKEKVDFFSIDTEGFDLEVLKSNNWKKFKPKVICIEEDNTEKFLVDIGYTKVHQTPTNSIFALKSV